MHHAAAVAWFAGHGGRFATTPITQGTLLRYLIREGLRAGAAIEVLGAIGSHARHDFWTDDVPYRPEVLRGVIGHRQVTDAYLAAQARSRSGRLATFDRGLAALHPDVTDLLTN